MCHDKSDAQFMKQLIELLEPIELQQSINLLPTYK